MPTLPTGLVRDSKSGVYYLRRRIPNEVLSCYPGKIERTFSLRTKDFKTALERHRKEEAKLTVEWDAELRKIRRFYERSQPQPIQKIDTLTPEIIDAICGKFEISSLTSDDILRAERQYDAEDISAYKAGYAAANSFLRAAVGEADSDPVRPLLEQFLHLARFDLNVSEPEMHRLALAYARTAIRTNEKLLKRFDGDDVPTPEPKNIRATPLLSEVIHDYTSYYERLNKPQMLKKVSAVLPLLLQMVGNKPIGGLTQTDFTTFFDDVQTLPPRWKDYCRIHKVTPKEASSRRVGEISKSTFDGTYVAAISPFLEYCRSHWQDQGWPVNVTVDGIRYFGRRAEPENGQRAFKPHELKRLFEGPEMEALSRSPDEAYKFWLPHLGIFTGARANELCQLNPQCDIRRDEGTDIWFLDITSASKGHEEIKKSVKNRTSRRRVPIHPTLIELGFLEYVAELKSSGKTLLFPGFPPSVGRAAPKAGEWFTDFLRLTGLRDETPGAKLVGMHAFRYTLSNQGEELGVVNTESITGHANKITNLETAQNGMIEGASSTVVRKYRGELSVAKKMEILKKIQYGDLQFFAPQRREPAKV
jgi:integrase